MCILMCQIRSSPATFTIRWLIWIKQLLQTGRIGLQARGES